MTTEKSPIRPSSDAVYRAEHRSATRTLLVDTLAAQPLARFSRRRKITVIAATSVGVALLGSGGAFAYAQLTNSAPVTDTHSARCYSEPSTNFGPDFPGGTVAAVNTSAGDGHVVAPIGLCRYLWSIGRVKPGSTDVPPLIGCVLPDGTAGVFPGDATTCADLGLPVADGSGTPSPDAPNPDSHTHGTPRPGTPSPVTRLGK